MILPILYRALSILILANVLISWIPSARWHPVGKLVLLITEPLLIPFRRLLGPVRVSNGMSLDFSPFVCLLTVQIVFGILGWMHIRF